MNSPANLQFPINRRGAFRIADKLLFAMSHEQWWEYLKALMDSVLEPKQAAAKARDKVAEFERRGLPYFIRKRLLSGIEQVARRNVPAGKVAVTYMYNHGFVVETKETAVGIDLAGPYTDRLAPVLDALVVSHWHPDHFNAALVIAMRKAGKPVFGPGHSGMPDQVRKGNYPGGFVFPKDGEQATVRSMKLLFPRGDHYPQSYAKYNAGRVAVSTSDMLDTLLFTDARAGKPSLTFLHDGDDFNRETKRAAARMAKVDVFLGHGVPSPKRWVGKTGNTAKQWWELNDSIGDPAGTVLEINPRLFIPGHHAERGHADGIGGCTPFKDAVEVAKLLPKNRGLVLMWGERILLNAAPGAACSTFRGLKR